MVFDCSIARYVGIHASGISILFLFLEPSCVPVRVTILTWIFRLIAVVVPGGGGYSKKVLYGEAPPPGPTPYLFHVACNKLK